MIRTVALLIVLREQAAVTEGHITAVICWEAICVTLLG